MPSGTIWARDNVEASPFFFDFGEPVDYLNLSVPDDCIDDLVIHMEAPTADQMAELLKYTRHKLWNDGNIFWELTSEINGEKIFLPVGVDYYDWSCKHVQRTIASHY